MSCDCHRPPMMGKYQFEPESSLEGWSEDAQAAMTANPAYFVWWYSAKSIALVAVAVAAAYYVGKNNARRPPLGRYRRRR